MAHLRSPKKSGRRSTSIGVKLFMRTCFYSTEVYLSQDIAPSAWLSLPFILFKFLPFDMYTTISYVTIIGLLANPPSIDPCTNFFNLRDLHTHFAQALKKILYPQSGVKWLHQSHPLVSCMPSLTTTHSTGMSQQLLFPNSQYNMHQLQWIAG